MSPARAPMQPPFLEGYEFVRLLGSGGYSDVFLYQQQMPRREVAIKVLVGEGLGEDGRELFQLEANAMASVSTHPFIVTVFHAGVSDLGQPYLVMEYYPQPNFSVRARSEQLSIAEVLRVGVQISSAVETAHRAGILHRDIKPANILTSEYNRPGLTDFGIATSVADGAEAEGMSIPWAPPEVINGSAPGDVTADVYSLGATVYTLLAGRSPFEVTGGSNRSLDLVARIESSAPPPTGRPDVPDSLERLLRHAMSTRPRDRPAAALDLARMLQEVEIEQGWSATHLEVRDDSRKGRARSDAPDDDGTRLKSPTVVESQGAPGLIDRVDLASGGPSSARPNSPDDGRTVARSGRAASSTPLIQGVGSLPPGLVRPIAAPGPASIGAVASTPQSLDATDGSVAADTPAPNATRRQRTAEERRSRRMAALAAVAVLAVVATGALGAAIWPPATVIAPTSSGPSSSGALPDAMVPPPQNVRLSNPVNGEQIVTWEHDVEDPAEYEYQITPSPTGVAPVTSDGGDTATLTVGGAEPARCVSVVAVRYDGGSSGEAEGCVPVEGQ